MLNIEQQCMGGLIPTDIFCLGHVSLFIDRFPENIQYAPFWIFLWHLALKY